MLKKIVAAVATLGVIALISKLVVSRVNSED